MDKATQEIVNSFRGKALNYNVIIHKIANKNVTESGLDTSMAVDKSEKFKKGIVVSIGTSCPEGDIGLGSTVIYDSYKASNVTLENVEYSVVMFGDLMHVL